MSNQRLSENVCLEKITFGSSVDHDVGNRPYHINMMMAARNLVAS